MAAIIQMKLESKEVDDWLKSVKKNLVNTRPFFKAIQIILSKSMALNFRRGGRPRWTSLSPWTMAVRTAGGTMGKTSFSQNILQQTGRLRGSVTAIQPKKGAIRTMDQRGMTWGTNLPYAGILQFGGTVTPTRGKYLTLPFPGVHGKARSYENTFVKKSKKGNLIIFQNMGGGQIRPLFLLRKKVKIPSRPFLYFHRNDIRDISNLALAFASDPEGYRKLAAKSR